MPLSRAEQALLALTGVYDHAFEALHRNDLARVEALIDEADEILAELAELDEDSELTHALRDKARERYGCLMSALSSARSDVRAELADARRARKALRAFGRTARR